MTKGKFLKAPLTPIEKEKKAEEFLNFTTAGELKEKEVKDKEQHRVTKKEPTKPMPLRFPRSLAEDIAEIAAITGLSMNAICTELLRPAVKSKLKELKE
ncbi:MAG: hypothetical protein LCH20_00205 [Proteobacteria bacterium]|nr:hypothetical protein [Pseudomonadota bacterium]